MSDIVEGSAIEFPSMGTLFWSSNLVGVYTVFLYLGSLVNEKSNPLCIP